MKPILFIFVFLWLIAGCGEPTTPDTGNDSTVHNLAAPDSASRGITYFKAYLDTADKRLWNASSMAIEQMKIDMRSAHPAMVDSALTLFLQFQDTLLVNLNRKHQDHAFAQPLAEKLALKKDTLTTDEQRYLDSLKQNGFDVSFGEGSSFITRNWSFVQTALRDRISPAMRDYLAQLHKESREPLARDGAITITPEELVDRLIWWERFNYANKAFIYREQAIQKQRHFIAILFRGMPNTPIFSRDGKPNEFYLQAYEHLGSNYANTQSSNLLQPYIQALQAGDRIKARSVMEEQMKSAKLQ